MEKSFTNEAASSKIFLEIAPNFKVLHLAMHALVEDYKPQFSKLLFSSSDQQDKLTAMELYPLQLNADLVVLSACNSGYGKLKKGEAVMSLSHAFNYAGVPSTVMSLWQVPDGHTTDIMVNFYKALNAGQYKSEALRSAKLKHLEEYRGMPDEHPYFWAGFIGSGNMLPLEPKHNSWLYGIIGFIGLSLVMLLYWKRK